MQVAVDIEVEVGETAGFYIVPGVEADFPAGCHAEIAAQAECLRGVTGSIAEFRITVVVADIQVVGYFEIDVFLGMTVDVIELVPTEFIAALVFALCQQREVHGSVRIGQLEELTIDILEETVVIPVVLIVGVGVQ